MIFVHFRSLKDILIVTCYWKKSRILNAFFISKQQQQSSQKKIHILSSNRLIGRFELDIFPSCRFQTQHDFFP